MLGGEPGHVKECGQRRSECLPKVRVELADQGGNVTGDDPRAQHQNALGCGRVHRADTGTHAIPVHEVRVVSAILVAARNNRFFRPALCGVPPLR